MELPNKKYQVVYADPPWSYYGAQDKMGAAAKFYPTMSDEDLMAMDIQSVLEKPGVLFMWVTSPRLDFGIRLIESWGLTYRGVAFTWVKTKSDQLTPIGAQGVRPSVVKPTAEFVLVASNVAKGRPLPLADEGVPHVVLASKMEHSRKPDEVHRRIERLYPDATKLEMFARRPMAGWDVWGNDPAVNQGEDTNE
jgi:N6-adenosine-specific RNA methylase IME4